MKIKKGSITKVIGARFTNLDLVKSLGDDVTEGADLSHESFESI